MRGGDQKRSCALAERYGKLGRDPEALIALLIEPAIHAYMANNEDFTEPGFVWFVPATMLCQVLD